MISVSEKAKSHILELRNEAGLSHEFGLRVSVVGGGCSGLSYNLDFDNESQKGDQIFGDDDLKIFVNLKSYLYLADSKLDFSDGLKGKGFHFTNPNASRECGCGESFGI